MLRTLLCLTLVASAHGFLTPLAPSSLATQPLGPKGMVAKASGPQPFRPSALRPASSSAPKLLMPAASQLLRPSAPVVRASASEGEAGLEKSGGVDYAALSNYFLATIVQVGFICVFMIGIERVGFLIRPEAYQILVGGFFAFMSLRSRVFSSLDASRPRPEGEWEVKRPSWTPPRMAFPVIWSSIAVLRTVSSVLIWEAGGRQMLTAPLIAMVTHLSIGDTWNCITNVEKRRGTSLAGMPFVWGSVVTVVVIYYLTLPLAGLVLAPSALWISIASALIFSIWKLNGEESLLPLKLPELPEKPQEPKEEAKA